MKSLCDEIDHLSPLPTCSCNGCVCGLTKQYLKLQRDQHMLNFLMKLDNHFNQVHTNILMMDQLPTISQAFRLLLQEYCHKELSKCNTPEFPTR